MSTMYSSYILNSIIYKVVGLLCYEAERYTDLNSKIMPKIGPFHKIIFYTKSKKKAEIHVDLICYMWKFISLVIIYVSHLYHHREMEFQLNFFLNKITYWQKIIVIQMKSHLIVFRQECLWSLIRTETWNKKKKTLIEHLFLSKLSIRKALSLFLGNTLITFTTIVNVWGIENVNERQTSRWHFE